MSEPKRAKRYYISGRVQGVGYRYFAHGAASRLGLAGYAKNLRDGRVEVYAIGTDEQLRALAEELRRGPRHASVTDVGEIDADILPEFASSFSIETEDGR